MKTFKYLGYTFYKNDEENEHIQQTTKKANIALPQTWGIGHRKFKNNFKLRMLLFDKLIASIIMYGAEIWGWKEQSKIEKIQTKYVRWILGLDTQTPVYIIEEETKRFKMKTEAGRRAMKYEEKLRRTPWKSLAYDCWVEISRKEETKQEKNQWEAKRAKFYESNRHSTTDIERRRNTGYSMVDEITRTEQDNQILLMATKI